jgi:thiol-disulfide isomerase/thioredoxin
MAVVMIGGCSQQNGFQQIELKADSGELPALLKAEAARAKAQNLTPVVEITAPWCGPCQELKASMDDPLMKDAFAGTYIIHVDNDTWKPQFAAAGLDVKGIPAFFLLDDDGKAVARIDGGAWEENIPKNMAPPLKTFFNQ